VVVRIDEARRYDSAPQVLCSRRGFPGTDLGDEVAVDPDPAAFVLRAGVVHRHDPRVPIALRNAAHEISSGTSSNRSTSTVPRTMAIPSCSAT